MLEVFLKLGHTLRANVYISHSWNKVWEAKVRLFCFQMIHHQHLSPLTVVTTVFTSETSNKQKYTINVYNYSIILLCVVFSLNSDPLCRFTWCAVHEETVWSVLSSCSELIPHSASWTTKETTWKHTCPSWKSFPQQAALQHKFTPLKAVGVGKRWARQAKAGSLC